MKRNSAYAFLQKNGIDVGKDNFNYAAKNDNGIFWVNPHKSVLKQNWWLILDDGKQKEPKLYVFFIPANSLGEDQFYIRKDIKHVDQIQLQFEHKNGMFVDTTSKVDISQWLSKTLKYDSVSKSVDMMYQKIFFGAPGTGKSHRLDYDLFKDANGKSLGKGLKSVSQDFKFRTTFHPDYDYAQFVGSYKPKKEGASITYSFVPQVFAKAYVAAWNKFIAAGKKSTADNQVYLVIEEINRGNCAQIFGDIFQLLDRMDGRSEYPVDVDSDFADFIREKLKDIFSDYKKEICSYCEDASDESQIADDEFCKIALPPNFNILATMNTSDQSLFPMDSAFKRRFDWEYVPIKYTKDADCGDCWDADKFVIKLDDETCYSWLDFLEKVNDDIYDVSQSEDKQMGEFFVKPKDHEIDQDMFLSKVMFYLWDSVYKDEVDRTNVFHFDWTFANGKKSAVTFQNLFKNKADTIEILKKVMEKLKVEAI